METFLLSLVASLLAAVVVHVIRTIREGRA